MKHLRPGYVAIVAALCGAALAMQSTAPAADQPASPGTTTAASKAPVVAPTMTVYKNATCGCCGKWVEHMQRHGFELTVHDVDNMSPVKERVGLPYGMGSCLSYGGGRRLLYRRPCTGGRGRTLAEGTTQSERARPFRVCPSVHRAWNKATSSSRTMCCWSTKTAARVCLRIIRSRLT